MVSGLAAVQVRPARPARTPWAAPDHLAASTSRGGGERPLETSAGLRQAECVELEGCRPRLPLRLTLASWGCRIAGGARVDAASVARYFISIASALALLSCLLPRVPADLTSSALASVATPALTGSVTQTRVGDARVLLDHSMWSPNPAASHRLTSLRAHGTRRAHAC